MKGDLALPPDHYRAGSVPLSVIIQVLEGLSGVPLAVAVGILVPLSNIIDGGCQCCCRERGAVRITCPRIICAVDKCGNVPPSGIRNMDDSAAERNSGGPCPGAAEVIIP